MKLFQVFSLRKQKYQNKVFVSSAGISARGFDTRTGGFNFGEYPHMHLTLPMTKNNYIMNQDTFYVADSLGVIEPQTVEKANWSIAQLFVEGGVSGMIIITLFLIALLLAAWKAPRWVKEIGIGGLVTGIYWTLRGLYQMFGTIQMFGNISFSVVCGGLRVAMIGTFYGLIVYFISLIIRVAQKPRI